MAVWDCCCLNDELDLLEFRLRYLDPVVDVFVIAESSMTFRSKPKALHLTDNLERFARWRHKLRIVPVLDAPVGTAPFAVERHQHAALRGGLGGAAPDDLIIVGDPDEIPRRHVVRQLVVDLAHPSRLLMSHSVNFANHCRPRIWDDGPMACRHSDVDHPDMGVLLGDPEAHWTPGGKHVVADAGWHLSYLGGVERITSKLGDFSHAELDRAHFRDARHLARCLDAAIDLQGDDALKVIPASGFDEILQALQSERPEWFSFTVRPIGPGRSGLRAYAHLRAAGKIPRGAMACLDRLSTTTLGLACLVLVPFDALLRVKRQAVSDRRLRPHRADVPPRANQLSAR
jgi:hypothetical protein